MAPPDATGPPAADGHDGWFFITGCQRSGTTLMRLVLECHSQIQCVDEALAYGVLAGRRALPPRDRPLLGWKVPCLAEQFGDRSLWDAYVLPETPNPYRGQRIVFMMRDVRDTIRSMEALRPYGRAWLDTHLVPTLRSKTKRDRAFRTRYAAPIARLETARHPRLARAAFYWRYKAEAVLDYLERGFPVLLVRYEDLVRQAELELLRVCGFLQVRWEPGLLQHQTFPHVQLNQQGLATGGSDPARAIDTQSVGRWHNTFTDDELDEILEFAGHMHIGVYGPAPACLANTP